MRIFHLHPKYQKIKYALSNGFLFTCIGIVGIYIGFSAVIFITSESQTHLISKLYVSSTKIATASEYIPPTISISEIMSCPLTNGKEWIELARNKISLANQVPFSQEYSITGYRLEDDKSTIWTGNISTPVTFSQNQELAKIELNKQYLNNTGDKLKLWSPAGELLDEAIIPACKETGLSWSFQDGEWLSGIPSPGEPNPIIPIPTPMLSPSTTPSPTPVSSPTPNPSATPQPTTVSNLSPAATQQISQTQSTNEVVTKIQKSSSIDPSYIQKISLTTSENKNLPTTQSAITALSSTKVDTVLGISTEASNKSKTDQDTQHRIDAANQSSKDPHPTIFHEPLPARSPSAYISAILGGVLLTTSGGLYTVQTKHTNGQSQKKTQNTS